MVIIVGERINATRNAVRRAIERRDASFIQHEARAQADDGADYIDVNAGTDIDREADDLAWLVCTVQEAVDRPLCIDSALASAQAEALRLHRGQAIVNSISAEPGRYEAVLPLVEQHDALVVALTMKTVVPASKEDRLAAAEQIVQITDAAGIERRRLFFDPVVATAATDNAAPLAVCETVTELKRRWPECRVIVGLSNVSYGLPQRGHLNRAFLALLVARGLDAAIMDPTEPTMVATVRAADVLLGRDEFCMRYIGAHRAGRL